MPRVDVHQPCLRGAGQSGPRDPAGRPVVGHHVGVGEVVDLHLALGRRDGDPALADPCDPSVAHDPHAVRRQHPLQPLVGSRQPHDGRAGQDQLHVEVVQHPRTTPVVAGHEQGLQGGRTARRGLRGHREQHASRGQPREGGPHPRGRLDDEGRPRPPCGVGVRQAGSGVPVLLEPGADDERRAADPPTVPGAHPRAGRVDLHDGLPDRRTAGRDHRSRRPLQRGHRRFSGAHVVEQRPVAMDGLGLHHRDVPAAVPEQLRGQRDPSVATADDQDLVVVVVGALRAKASFGHRERSWVSSSPSSGFRAKGRGGGRRAACPCRASTPRAHSVSDRRR